MNTTKCDICSRTEPDVYCRYSRRKKWGWFQHNDDSQGGYEFEQDVCEQCWKGYQSFMQNKIDEELTQ